MELILHIGTHKTGTSALQECLRRNERRLAGKNIYYARSPRSKTSNALARWISKKFRADAEACIGRHLDKANALGVDTVLLSAESLYGMTTFFHRFNGRECFDYWKLESEAVEFLRGILPTNMSTRIVVFFRRQDRFLESIYRQVVKSRAVAETINEFSVLMRDALDYWGHMQVWSRVFPDCTVYTYEEASNDISGFFLRNVLKLTNFDEFEALDLRVNMQMSRDVLEYKRMLNAMNMSAVDRFMSDFACTELARTLTHEDPYRDYLAPGARGALLREMAPGNKLLNKTFGMKPFPNLGDDNLKSWVPYPGLSAEAARELAEGHARIRRSLRYQIERAGMLGLRLVKKRLPLLAGIIPVGRWILPRHRRRR